MKQSARTLSRGLAAALAIGAFAAVSFGDTPAEAQYRPPPAEVVATLVPVYYEGHAAYWYDGHWHYRDARGAWAHYHVEPAFLRDHRTRYPSRYHHYGRRR
ncbi:Hypothetical protein A7982_06359 [Minicystis rosea]|nr:Hypothetical protein A7982_06359 [Minicystis rosea]